MKPVVIKIGGSTLGDNDTALEDIAALQADGHAIIVIHGGGSAATEWLKVHGVASEFINGLRVTGADSIDVVVAVFAGLVNKQLVADLQALGTKAIGLSGVDGSLIATRQADPQLGFVGEIVAVDRAPLDLLVGAGYVPVLSPVGFWQESVGQLMNINADTVAGEIAAVVEASELIFLTDVAAVRGPGGEEIAELGLAGLDDLIASGAATAGMVPKLHACARAASAGVRCRIIDGRESHALRSALSGAAIGTLVTA